MALYRIKTLSVREPWASLVFKCGKDVENRSWYTGYRGPLLIAASQTVDLSSECHHHKNRYQYAWEGLHGHLHIKGIKNLPLMLDDLDINPGHLLGLVWLQDCVHNYPSLWAVAGQFNWVLTKPTPFTGSYPCRGKLGLFETVIPLDDSKPGYAEGLAPYRIKNRVRAAG